MKKALTVEQVRAYASAEDLAPYDEEHRDVLLEGKLYAESPATTYSSAYSEKDGEAVTLLDSALGSGYANLGSLLYFCLTRNSSGNILVFVEDSHEYENLKETFYSLSDGKVTSTVLSGQSSTGGWDIDPETGEDRPAHLDAYQIDGKPSDAAAYEAKIKEFGMDDCLGVWCQDRYDMDTLDAFLTGQTDVYPGGALMETATHPQGGDGMPASWWADEVLYTVGE